MMEISYERLPETLRDGAKMWIEEGIRPGHFLSAVINNNLADAVGRADDQNVLRLHAIVGFWFNEAPARCWGSVDKAAAWAKEHADRRAEAEAKKASDA